MSSHSNESYTDYSSHRRRSAQPSPGTQQRFPEQLAPLDTTNVNQGIAHGTYDGAYHSPAPIDGTMNYYPAGASNPGLYPGIHQYQQGHGSGYQQHEQGAIPITYHPSGQTQARDVYPQPASHPQWTQGHHHHHGADIHRSASWSPQQINHPALQLLPYGSMSMSQIPHPNNNRVRGQVMLPQRPYIPHHRQNYFDQFTPEGDITFLKTTGGDGIALVDAMNESFDSLIGRDDPMFAGYAGPAISLRLEWPGYKSWTKQIKTKDWRREPKPITKGKLAFEVAKKVRDFMQDNMTEVMAPGAERWRVGPGYIEVKDLVLFRMVHVSKGSWQAEFRVFE